MNPYIICHMLSSVNGKIDGNALDVVIAEGEYDATGSKLEGDAWICGRTTMQQHFAEDELFVSASNTPPGNISARCSWASTKAGGSNLQAGPAPVSVTSFYVLSLPI
jgi:hypothetical protein